MVSKGEKLRAKRAIRIGGRPRKPDVERYPSGKIKQHETEKEVQSVGIEARKRVHQLETSDPLAGYTLGRMFLDGSIAKHHLDAAEYYGNIMSRYYSLVGIPFPSARAQSLFSVKGHDGDISDDRARQARRASNRFMEIEGLLLRLEDGPQVKSTVFNLTVMDYENMRNLSEQQLMWLKRGLNALHADKLLRTTGKSRITETTELELL